LFFFFYFLFFVVEELVIALDHARGGAREHRAG
jgi:hypothetical protein